MILDQFLIQADRRLPRRQAQDRFSAASTPLLIVRSTFSAALVHAPSALSKISTLMPAIVLMFMLTSNLYLEISNQF